MQVSSLDDILSLELNASSGPESPLADLPADGRDPRLLRTSYSASQTFAACKRKFQLDRLNSTETQESQDDWERSLTFQFGHSLGELVQYSIEGKLNRREILWQLFQDWKCDLLDENPRQQKSFFHIVIAADVFWARQEQGLFADYEVAEFEGKPAIELAFRIKYPNGTVYRGFVDAVLRNKHTGEYVILEVKSSSANYVQPLMYKNSEQALGYSVVLDRIAPGLTNYTVEYLVYMTKSKKFENFSFPKTYTQRALWVRDRVWEAEEIDRLIESEGSYGNWPTSSLGCFQYFSPCQYMDMCQMSTGSLIQPLREHHLEPHQVDAFEIDLLELINDKQ